MTILSAAQSVSKKISIKTPGEFYSSTVREVEELRDVCEEMADRIAEGHDWQVLSRQGTVTGDGTTEALDLPSDYDRQTVGAEVWSSSLETPLTHISDLNRWLGLDIQSFDFVVNAWTIYGGQIHFKPALASGVTAQFFYQSNLIVTDTDGTTNKLTFEEDGDTFRLDEGLLELAAIWRWKAYKGQSYAEEIEDYQEKLERLVLRDKGSRSIRIGRVRLPSDVRIAYPQTIVG